MAMTSSANSSSGGRGGVACGAARAPWPTLAATAVVALAGCAALYQATLGLRVVSTEDGRRLAIAEAPRAVPAAALDWRARPRLDATLRADGRVAIVAFIYTSCNAVCSVLGSQFQQLQQAIVARGLQGKVRLLSISFDPRDDTATLAAYAQRQHADAAAWQFAGIPVAAERRAVLATFGVVVVPAPLGEFVHNAAFHIVDTRGRLARIDDIDRPEQALADAVALYDASATHDAGPR
jgi:protein SCO1/2